MAALPLAAGAIVDVSTHTTQQMNPGDTLSFLVSNLSLHTVIDSVEFQFISQPLDSSAQFEAELTSRDGSVSIAFPSPLQVSAGIFSGSGYQGAISAISGTLRLPPTLSQQIFQNTRATVVLQDIGPAVTLGLPGYTLPQDMTLSLTSGDTSAGAVTSGAWYQDPPVDDAPESDSGMLVAGAGVLLCACSGLLKRISCQRSQ